jgi:hypothetical protein
LSCLAPRQDRQLTDAAGFMQNPDGSIRVELPGPFGLLGAAPLIGAPPAARSADKGTLND